MTQKNDSGHSKHEQATGAAGKPDGLGKNIVSIQRLCLLISTSKSLPQAGAQKEYNPGYGSGQTLPLWTGAKMQRYINRLSHTQKAGK